MIYSKVILIFHFHRAHLSVKLFGKKLFAKLGELFVFELLYDLYFGGLSNLPEREA